MPSFQKNKIRPNNLYFFLLTEHFLLTWEWEGGVLLRLTFQERQVLDNNRLIACKAKGLHYFKSIIEDQPGSIFTHKSKEKGDHL